MPDAVRVQRTGHHGEVRDEGRAHRAADAGARAACTAAVPSSRAGLGVTIQR